MLRRCRHQCWREAPALLHGEPDRKVGPNRHQSSRGQREEIDAEQKEAAEREHGIQQAEIDDIVIGVKKIDHARMVSLRGEQTGRPGQQDQKDKPEANRIAITRTDSDDTRDFDKSEQQPADKRAHDISKAAEDQHGQALKENAVAHERRDRLEQQRPQHAGAAGQRARYEKCYQPDAIHRHTNETSHGLH